MSKKKYAAFAAAVFFISAGALIATFAAGDWYVHQKLQKKGMYNIWGYRGPVAGPKKRGEFRIAVLGGSTALGYGAPVGQSFPAHLERMLNEKPRKGGPEFYSVVNLAWNNEGAHSFVHTLKDYAYLSYDAVIFYTRYNDLIGKNLAVFRHRSPVFKLTGYMPLLPGMMLDKAKMLRLGLSIDDINMGRKRTNFWTGQKLPPLNSGERPPGPSKSSSGGSPPRAGSKRKAGRRGAEKGGRFIAARSTRRRATLWRRGRPSPSSSSPMSRTTTSPSKRRWRKCCASGSGASPGWPIST